MTKKILKTLFKAILVELLQWYTIALSQLFALSPHRQLEFNPNAEYRMREWGVSKADVADVFYYDLPVVMEKFPTLSSLLG